MPRWRRHNPFARPPQPSRQSPPREAFAACSGCRWFAVGDAPRGCCYLVEVLDPLPPPPLLTRSFVLLMAGHLLQALGYASMLLLPLYLQHLQASRAQIGLVMATAAISSVAGYPLVAYGLDRVGRRPTLMVGTLLLVGGMGLIGLVDRIGPVLYLARVTVGLGISALFSGYFTAAADIIPVARRTEGLALFGLTGLLPLLINPFADRIGITPSDLRWFLPAVGCIISLSLILLWRLPESKPRAEAVPNEVARGGVRAIVRVLSAPALWPVWLATVVFGALVALFMNFATVTASSRGVAHAPMMWLSYAAGAALVRTLGRRLPDRVGPANLVSPALAFYLCAALLMTQAASLSALLLAALLAGVGHGYLFPVLSGQLVTRVPPKLRGTAMASFTSLWELSDLCASPSFGHIADGYGDAAMFLVAFLLGAGALVGWVWLEHRFGPKTVADVP